MHPAAVDTPASRRSLKIGLEVVCSGVVERTTRQIPLLQHIYVLLKVQIIVGRVYTNIFIIRCYNWHCKGLLHHIYKCW